MMVMLALLAFMECPLNAQQQTIGAVSYEDHSLIRATPTSEAQLSRLLEICPRVFSEHVGVGDVDVVANQQQKRALRREGIAFTVLIPNLQPMIQQERNRLAAAQGGVAGGAAFFNDFRDYNTIIAQLDALAAANPAIAQVSTIGMSVENRAIKVIRISSSLTPKPGVMITACQHAREWITPMTAMFVADALIQGAIQGDPQIQSLLGALEFYIVPVVNPDGYVYSWGPDRLWRKSRRPNGDGSFGVDLNRNWPIGFGGESTSTQTNSDLYHGIDPFSEPETQAIRDFVFSHPNILATLDLHSYSQLVLQPWSYTATPPPAYGCVDEVGGRIAKRILGVHGKHYPHGSGNAVIYLAGGTIHDWMFGDQGLLAYTLELRPESATPGFVLPPGEIVPTGEEIFEAVLELADISLDPFYVTLEGVKPEFLQADEPTPIRVAILPMSAGMITVGSETIFTRIGTSGPFTETPLTWLGNLTYQATLPAAPCGQVVQYYFKIHSSITGELTLPGNAPAQVFELPVRNITTVFHDNMETDTGWTVGAPGDSATTGIWTRVAPGGAFGNWNVPAQPSYDNPNGTGTHCWITGQDNNNPAGLNDVDGGSTTLTSPIFDASGSGDAYVSYFRWYSNHTGSNPHTETMPIEISNDGGNSWTLLEEVSFNETKWFHRSFRIADFIAPTHTMRVRFIARDLTSNGGAVVEAGVDDFLVTLVDCEALPCFGDIVSNNIQPPGDGIVNGSDLAYLLGQWGVNPGSIADLVDSATIQPPPDGVVDGADLAYLLGAWGPCPN